MAGGHEVVVIYRPNSTAMVRAKSVGVLVVDKFEIEQVCGDRYVSTVGHVV